MWCDAYSEHSGKACKDSDYTIDIATNSNVGILCWCLTWSAFCLLLPAIAVGSCMNRELALWYQKKKIKTFTNVSVIMYVGSMWHHLQRGLVIQTRLWQYTDISSWQPCTYVTNVLICQFGWLSLPPPPPHTLPPCTHTCSLIDSMRVCWELELKISTKSTEKKWR